MRQDFRGGSCPRLKLQAEQHSSAFVRVIVWTSGRLTPNKKHRSSLFKKPSKERVLVQIRGASGVRS